MARKTQVINAFDFQQAFDNINSRLDSIVTEQTKGQVHLAKVDTHLSGLLGNGQPGRIKEIEDGMAKMATSIGNLIQDRAYLKGYVAAIGLGIVLVGALGNYLLKLWMR
jgi:hypothetical protein